MVRDLTPTCHGMMSKKKKLWNIARHYNSSIEEIMLINDLKEELKRNGITVRL